MSLGIWNLQWLNHNSQRAYPIMDACSRRCTEDENIRLPDDVILALTFTTHAGLSVDSSRFYIKSIITYNTGCSIELGYEGDTVAVTHIQYTEDEIQTALLIGTGDFDDTIGYVAINTNAAFLKSAYCVFNFDVDTARLELDCIRPMLQGVSSLRIRSAGSESARFHGDIILQAGSNIILRAEKTATGAVITISAINQDFEDQCPNDSDNATMSCIKSINGVTPNTAGDITLTGTSCISISGDTISDTCAEPCCGCTELNALTEELESFAAGKTTMESFLQQLLSGFAAIQAIILGSARVNSGTEEDSEADDDPLLDRDRPAESENDGPTIQPH